ncbi:MAG: cobalamin biosynthesis protein CbiA [Deltaproteobacteria bacterium]|nr:cobalamin biosynthesis protein CbiA [Deltaproteobacteria bacterium]
MLLGTERATLIVGHFGSGKSEVAVHLALAARSTGREVSLVDLDLVNPYFRSREAADLLEAQGIRVVLPARGLRDADLPILVPQVRAHLEAATSYGVLDVGGDDVGARVLGSLSDSLAREGHRVLMVLNALRPFSDTVAGCRRVQHEIEAAARLRVTGFVSNAHLMEGTDAAVVRGGVTLARAAAADAGLPLEFFTAPRALAPSLEAELGLPALAIDRTLLPPWLKPGRTAAGATPRPGPLFGPQER